MSEHDDLLDDLSRADADFRVPSEAFRAAVLSGTEGVLARRRGVRRGVSAVFVIAVAVTAFAVGRVTAPEALRPEPSPSKVEEHGASPVIDLANGSPDELKEAGDRLSANGDVESALAFYRRYLDTASRDRLEPHVDDGWLLASLKLDLE